MELLKIPVSASELRDAPDSSISRFAGKNSDEITSYVRQQLSKAKLRIAARANHLVVHESHVYVVVRVGRQNSAVLFFCDDVEKTSAFLKDPRIESVINALSGIAQSLDPVSGFEPLNEDSKEILGDLVRGSRWERGRLLLMCVNGDSVHILPDGRVAWHIFERNTICESGDLETLVAWFFQNAKTGQPFSYERFETIKTKAKQDKAKVPGTDN